ncbi:MAG: putative DNA modification/repair radical SAM protein [bacterium]|nr:putative DNA modification/repair radical SAM protein [bacterium]
MDTFQKLELLGSSAKYDICCSSSRTYQGKPSYHQARRRSTGLPNSMIYPAFLSDGRCIPLFKVLQTNFCNKDCFYCVNRKSRDIPRITFQPEELADIFLQYYRLGLVKGLFLSSGVYPTADSAMEQMIKTADILRNKKQFNGYIHLKILPGTSYALVDVATRLASRSSINLEAPNSNRLNQIASNKDFHHDLLTRINWLQSFVEQGRLHAGITTQFVVGAANETDLELLKTTDWLYKTKKLRRTYFSGFQPISDTPLEKVASTSPTRELRLYQADYLLRQYKFRLEELTFDKSQNLPLDADPKYVWAINHPAFFPVEVNQADYEILLRVPGIGPQSAKRIVNLRKTVRFTDISQLKEIGVVTKRAQNFLLVNGKKINRQSFAGIVAAIVKPIKPTEQSIQLEFWEET